MPLTRLETDMDDDDFGTLFRRAVATLDPPSERLAEAGLQRGRRQRQRRRLAGVGTGAAVLAGVVGLGAAVLSAGAGGGSGRTAAGSGGARPVAVTPQAVLQTALDTLPAPGRTSGYAGAGMDGYSGTTFVYDDGHGAAAVQVTLEYPPAHAGRKSPGAVVVCKTKADGDCSVLADGSHLRLRQGQQDTSGVPNSTEWEAQLVRPDGVSIDIIEWNAPEPKAAPGSRPAPPFTMAELAAWVEDPVWQSRIPAHRATATARLFTPADLQAKVAGANSHGAVDCAKAAHAHKLPAGSCPTGH